MLGVGLRSRPEIRHCSTAHIPTAFPRWLSVSRDCGSVRRTTRSTVQLTNHILDIRYGRNSSSAEPLTFPFVLLLLLLLLLLLTSRLLFGNPGSPSSRWLLVVEWSLLPLAAWRGNAGLMFLDYLCNLEATPNFFSEYCKNDQRFRGTRSLLPVFGELGVDCSRKVRLRIAPANGRSERLDYPRLLGSLFP
ncbi:hypothetical protein BDV06DRAFT_188886 [Aspergillus oleicola]